MDEQQTKQNNNSKPSRRRGGQRGGQGGRGAKSGDRGSNDDNRGRKSGPAADSDADETKKKKNSSYDNNTSTSSLKRRPRRGNSRSGRGGAGRGGRGNSSGRGGASSIQKESTSSAARSNTSNRNKSNRDGNATNGTNNKSEGRNGKRQNKARTKKVNYEPHQTYTSCLQRYTSTSTSSGDSTIIRGKLRVMPSKNGAAFVTCDRGSLLKDVLIKDETDRNRGLDGDIVFVELYPIIQSSSTNNGNGTGDVCVGEIGEEKQYNGKDIGVTIADFMNGLELTDDDGDTKVHERGQHGQKQVAAENTVKDDTTEDNVEGEVEYEEEEYLIGEEDAIARAEKNNNIESSDDEEDNNSYCENTEEGSVEMWHDDDVQMSLWDPVVNLRKRSKRSDASSNERGNPSDSQQRNGKIICIIPPKSSAGQQPSEFNPEDESYRKQIPKRTIVGTLTQLPNSQGGGGGGGSGSGGRYLLVPNKKSLPRFMCSQGTKPVQEDNKDADNTTNGINSKALYRAEYTYGTWHATNKWPPCTNVTRLCGTCNVDDETKALLVENGVDHGEFPPAVLRDVEQSVKSGRFLGNDGDMGWKPTEDMCRGRRDYRNHRVFTIDPTTAKDLDDALHITPLPDGRVEIGVHIADVSHFIQPKSAVDEEALKRATTVYLVNGIVPMLPRPLCEIACSLNEDVERLAFSCVWRMNMDGTLSKKGGMKGQPKKDDIWYGRTVIKSCARLDYATAQNIIDGKVATGEKVVDETFWPKSRQPTGGHTIDQVAADVKLMHNVAMARRKLRFDNGALALNGVKLAFQLEEDGETPKLCAPYPIRDSNRLIEEYMLMANYLVAQRLITHAHGRALLRNHSPPIDQGMQQVVDVSKESFNFDIDTTNSRTLQESLSRLTLACNDELVVQCVTESLMTPMRPAEYMAAGELDEEDWQHFALNIPYYTHFTSPIRRYPDVIVHRLLQATLDDDVDDYPMKQKEVHEKAGHCNDMRMSAKKAQERSDRVFLSLYLKKNPIESVLGVCLGVGEKTFTVFVPSLGMSTRVFLQEHEDEFNINAFEEESTGKRRIVINPKTDTIPGMQPTADGDSSAPEWKSLDIRVFTKLRVACTCKMQPPIDVRVKVVGPWTE